MEVTGISENSVKMEFSVHPLREGKQSAAFSLLLTLSPDWPRYWKCYRKGSEAVSYHVIERKCAGGILKPKRKKEEMKAYCKQNQDQLDGLR